MSLVIVPGSFDPMTLGHLDVVRYASQRYDEVVVAVMVNPEKTYLFDSATRAEIAKRTVSDLPNVRVIEDSGMLIDLYDRLGADAVCKGYRNERDLAYENRMAEWNLEHNPRFHTEMIKSSGEYAALSSTDVRDSLKRGESVAHLVHPAALPLVTKGL